MRKFKTLKLSQFHKEKTCWTENWWSSGIMSNFWGEFFYVLGGKKFLKFFNNILATALKSYIKWLLYFFFFWKSLKTLKKQELSPQNFRYDVLHLLYSGTLWIWDEPDTNVFITDNVLFVKIKNEVKNLFFLPQNKLYMTIISDLIIEDHCFG